MAGVFRSSEHADRRRRDQAETRHRKTLQEAQQAGGDESQVNFDLARWRQRYASPVWFDIRRTDVLNARFRKTDEQHICPLLEVIRRAVRLWSNPGEVVFSPFGGIGSELPVALEQKQGRSLVGARPER